MAHKKNRTGKVYFQGRPAGKLTESDRGYEFIYDSDYLAGGTPIAFGFPLQEEAFYSLKLPSFFENLVSEGWLLKLQSQLQKIDESDQFGLLLANGRDLVGAVTIEDITSQEVLDDC